MDFILTFPEFGIQTLPKIPEYQYFEGFINIAISQPLKEFPELVLPKKRLRMKKVKVPELVRPQKRLRKEKVSVPPTPLVIILGYLRSH